MGRVQGGARAAFATPSWGPARIKFFFNFYSSKPLCNNIILWRHAPRLLFLLA